MFQILARISLGSSSAVVNLTPTRITISWLREKWSSLMVAGGLLILSTIRASESFPAAGMAFQQTAPDLAGLEMKLLAR